MADLYDLDEMLREIAEDSALSSGKPDAKLSQEDIQRKMKLKRKAAQAAKAAAASEAKSTDPSGTPQGGAGIS